MRRSLLRRMGIARGGSKRQGTGVVIDTGPVAQTAPLHRYRASKANLSGGNVTNVPNEGTAGGRLDVVTGTIAAPAVDVVLNNAMSFAFTGSQELNASLPNGAFTFLHNGSAHSVILISVALASGSLHVNNYLANTGQPGFRINPQPAGGNFLISNGTSSPAPLTASLQGASTGARSYRTSFAGTVGLAQREGVVSTTSALTGALVATAPSFPLTVGRLPGSAFSNNSRFGELLIWDRVLSHAELLAVDAELYATYGVRVYAFDTSRVYGLSNLANANYYTTQAGGGEAGDVTTGFGGASIYMLNQLLPTAGNTGTLQGNYVFPTAGWRQEFTNPGSSTTMLARTIATSGTGTPTRTMLSSDLGKVALTAFVNTGAILRQYADDGTEIGAGIATTGFTPGTTAHRIGASSVAAGFTYGHTLAWITWRGTPTQAQIKAMFSAVRAAVGDFPSKAAIDALMPVRLGANGFTVSNLVQSGIGAGIAGVGTGFHVMLRVRMDAVTGTEVFIGRDNFSNAGWRVGRTGVSLTATFASGAGAPTNTATYTLPGTGRVTHLTIVHTGSAIQLWVDGVQVGVDVAITGFTPYAGGRMAIGTVSASYVATTTAVFDVSGGHFIPTAAEILASATGTENTGLQAISGKTEHLYRLHQDIAANGNAIPATFLDRVGTDHLTTVGAPTVTSYGGTVTHRWSLREALAPANVAIPDSTAAPATIPDSVTAATVDAMSKAGSPVVRAIDPGLYPRTSYGSLGHSATSYWKSATPGGIAGVSTGFRVGVHVCPYSITGGFSVLAARSDFATAGWVLIRNNANVNALVYSPTGTYSAAFVLTAATLGVDHYVELVHTGTAIQLFWDGVQAGSDVAAGTFAPYNGPTVLGALGAGQYPAINETLRGITGGNFVATPSEIAAAYQTFLSTGRLAQIAGKTSMHVDLAQDVIANGGPSAGIPATVLDRVGTDNLTRAGTGLAVAARTERLWSYETTPIFRGADGWSNSNYYVSSFTDTISQNAGWWWSLLVYIPTASVTSSILAGARSTTPGTSGWDVRAALNNASLGWYMGDGSVFNASGSAVMALDKLNLFVGVWDAAALKQRLYSKRAEVGTGTSRTAYSPATAASIGLGKELSLGTGNAVPNRNVLGFAMGQGVPTLAQVQAHFDAVQATETMQGMPAMTSSVLVDCTPQIVANGNALPAAFTNAGTVGGTFNRAGTPTLTTNLARAWAW